MKPVEKPEQHPPPLRARPIKNPDHGAMMREFMARYPKILKALAAR